MDYPEQEHGGLTDSRLFYLDVSPKNRPSTLGTTLTREMFVQCLDYKDRF